MASSTNILDLLQTNQLNKEKTQNALNSAFSPSALLAMRENTTDLLTWGYYGGNVLIGANLINIASGTLQLTDNATNYIEMNNTTGAITVNTTGFVTDGSKTPIYSVVVNAGLKTWTDFRCFIKIKGSDTYILPVASTTVLGGVKVDGITITATADGTISSTASAYTLPTASVSVLGGVKIDGTTITINNGVISSAASYTLPTASVSTKGGVRIDGTTITIDANGIISASGGSSYTLPTASTSVLGGVKVDGSTITINNGVISSAQYTLPTASTTTKGGVMVDGTTVTIDGTGKISAVASGGTTFTTNRVFDVKAVSGLSITIAGGRAVNLGGTGFYNSSQSIKTVADTTLTLPANTANGYIVYRNQNSGSIQFITGTNPLALPIQKPLYYFVTNATQITTLEWVGSSFDDFNGGAPIKEIIQTSWTNGNSYFNSVSDFVDLNTIGTSWNIKAYRLQFMCTSAELGYAVGDLTNAFANEPAVVIKQGGVYIITQASTPQILDRTAGNIGNLVAITPSKWKMVLLLEPIM